MATGASFPYQFLTTKTARIDFNNVYSSPRTQKTVGVRYVYLVIRNKQSGVSYKAVVNINGKTATLNSSASSTTGDQYWSCNVALTGITLTDRYANITLDSGTSSNVEIRTDVTTITAVDYYYNTPATPTSFEILDTDISNPIRVRVNTTDTLSNRKRIYIYENSGDDAKYFYSPTNNNIITIKPNAINQLSLYRVYANNVYYESWDTLENGYNGSTIYQSNISLNRTTPTLQTFQCTSSNIDTGIVFSWQPLQQTRYEIEVYQDGNLIYSKSENKPLTTITMPSSYLLNTNVVTAKLRIAYIASGYENDTSCYVYSDYKEVTLNPTYSNPSITNLNTVGDYYEKSIVVNWRSEYQTGYEYECYYNNVKVKNGAGTTAQTFTIPANTFAGTLPASVRVRVIRSINGQTLYSSWQERSISLKEITPTLADIELSGSNIDLPITVSWVSTDQQNYEVKIEKDSSTVKTYTGTTTTSVLIPAATLTTGLHKVSVRVAYSGRWTDWKSISATLIETLPSIGAFEPDGVIVERDDVIRLWWTSNNQSKWKVVIDETLTYTGTSEKEYNLPPATLQTGSHKMLLTVTYVTGAGVEKLTTKQAEFIVQGKPPRPTITSSSDFTTNRPIITWDTQDQQGYIMEVLKDNAVIYTTEWQNGLVTSKKVMNYLANGAYTVRIKVMNQYSLESDYGQMSITVNAEVSEEIALNTRAVDGGIYLWWDNSNYAFDYFYVLRNGLPIAKVYDTIYTDYTAHNIESYTIRGITSEECYKDSQTLEAVYRINRSVVATVDRLEDIEHIVVMTNQDLFSGNLSVENSLIHLAGRKNPVTIFGEHSTDTYQLKLVHTVDLFKFFEMFNRRQVFCYRDYLEKIYFTIQSLPYERDSRLIDYNATINATKVDFNEVVDYD